MAEHEHYRAFVIWKAAKGALHTLDFERIKDAEREAARALFVDESTGAPNALAAKLSIPTTSAVPGATVLVRKEVSTGAGAKGRLMTPDEKKRVLEALTRAQTADEVRKLERMLADGLIPEGGVDAAVAAA